jgi:hypothetical protein
MEYMCRRVAIYSALGAGRGRSDVAYFATGQHVGRAANRKFGFRRNPGIVVAVRSIFNTAEQPYPLCFKVANFL